MNAPLPHPLFGTGDDGPIAEIARVMASLEPEPEPAPEPEGREPAQMSVRNAALWAMGGQYLGFAIQFAASVVISRLFLTPPEVGLFSVALAAAALVAMLQDFGLSRYLSGLPSIDATEIARASSVALVFSLLVTAIVCGMAWPMALAYHEPRLVPIMLIIGASYLFLPLAVVPQALLARRMAFRSLFTINMSVGVAQAGLGVLLAWAGYSAFALAWATLGAAVARGVVAQALRPAAPWPLRFDGLKPIVGAGSRLTTLYASGALGTRTPDMIVGKLLGMLAVGLYSRATSLSDQFRMLMSGAIGSVFFPAFARIRDRGEPLGPAYLRVVAGYTAVIWPGMAGLALAAGPVVHLLYGPKWMGVASLLSLISLTEIFLVALPLHTDLPILLGRLNRLLAINAVDTVASIGLLAVFCHWGVAAAAGSRIVYGVVWVALYARFLDRLIGFDRRALFAIYGKSAAAALAALVPLAAVYVLWAGPATIALPVLIAAAGAGVVLWLAVLVALRHPALDDLLGIAEHLPFLGARLAPVTRVLRRA